MFTLSFLSLLAASSPLLALAQDSAVTPVRQFVEGGVNHPPRQVSDEEKALRLNEQAVQLTLQGDQQKAILLLEQALRLNPKSTTIRYNLAGIYLTQGKSVEAVSTMEHAVVLDSADLTLRNRFAEAHLANSNVEAAIDDYEKIISEDPSFERALFRLGSLYGMVGKLDLAEKTLRQAVQMFGDDERSLNNLASVLVVNHKVAEAVPLYEKAYEKTKSADTAVSLGLAYEELKNYQQALNYFTKAKEAVPGNAKIDEQISRVKKALEEKK